VQDDDLHSKVTAPPKPATDDDASVGDAKAAQAQPKLGFKKRAQAAIAGLLGSTVIRGLGMTARTRLFFRGEMHKPGFEKAALDEFRGPSAAPLLFAVWHGSSFPVVHYWRGRGLCVLTSRSADGQIVSGILRRLGYTTVHGSSSRGGSRALIDLARFVQHGGDAAITVDGPRGPAQRVKPGIVLLAKITGRPIIPLVGTADRFVQFQSWDRFRLPFPFTRMVIAGDEPIHVPADADHECVERKRMELEQKMRELQRNVDELIKPRVWRFREKKPKNRRA